MIKWTNISVLALAMLVVASLGGCGEEPETLQVSAPMALAEARDVMYEEVVSEYDIVRLHATEALDYSVGDEAGDVFIAGLTDKAGVPNCSKNRKAPRCTCPGVIVFFSDVVLAGNQAGRATSTSSRISNNCQ